MQGHNHCQMSRIWFPKYLLRSPQLHSIRDAESSTMLSHLNPTLRRTGLLVMCISDRNQVRASTLFRRSVLSRRQYRLLPRPCARAMHRCLAALTAGSWTIQWCHTQVEDASPTRISLSCKARIRRPVTAVSTDTKPHKGTLHPSQPQIALDVTIASVSMIS